MVVLHRGYPGSVQVRFVADEVALEQVLLRVPRPSPSRHHFTVAQ